MANRGPGVGDPAPPFSLIDPVDNATVSLTDFAGQDVLLVFFRGTWCPYCRRQLGILAQEQQALTAARIATIGVVCQAPGSVARYVTTHSLPFPLLPDPTRATAKAYGTHYYLSWDGFHLSHPALFILDASGKVTFRHIGRRMNDLPLILVLERFLVALRESAKTR